MCDRRCAFFVRRYVLCAFRWAMVCFSTCDMSLCIFRCAIDAVPFSTCDMCCGIFNRQYVLCVFRCVIYAFCVFRYARNALCVFRHATCPRFSTCGMCRACFDMPGERMRVSTSNGGVSRSRRKNECFCRSRTNACDEVCVEVKRVRVSTSNECVKRSHTEVVVEVTRRRVSKWNECVCRSRANACVEVKRRTNACVEVCSPRSWCQLMCMRCGYAC